ncbi:MAG: heavy metal-binding domain-containing protein [Bacteroidaceae bacterium]|nr:heavy metal-binding domain-containing protein [Bacteroidaceae bacterium]
MNSMYAAAKKQMQEKTIRLGANAIVGYHTDFDDISGKGKSMFMLSASGTACVVEQRS